MNSFEEIRIHARYLPKLLERIRQDRNNGSLLLNFYKQMSFDALSEARIVKVLTHLLIISGLVGKSFELAKKEDYIDRLSRARNERALKERTYEDYKAVLKSFLHWLGQDASWIKVRNVEARLLPEELLTPDEVHSMINAADDLRDKAFIHVLWDSDCRIGELLSLRIRHIAFDDQGGLLMVNGKTGMRRVRIIESANTLQQYLNQHPLKDSGSSPLWLIKWKPMNYVLAWKTLKKVAKRAGVRKRMYPHLFRHSRSTYLARKIPESVLARHAGWRPGSKMLAKYVHLSARDVDEVLSSIHVNNNKAQKMSVESKAISTEQGGMSEFLQLEEKITKITQKLVPFNDVLI